VGAGAAEVRVTAYPRELENRTDRPLDGPGGRAPPTKPFTTPAIGRPAPLVGRGTAGRGDPAALHAQMGL